MWLVVIALILAGLALIIVEIVFIPGTTIVGLLGLVFTVVGVVFSYRHFGSEAGSYVLVGTGVTTLVALYLSFRKGAWKKFSNPSTIDSKVNEGMAAGLTIGQQGVTTSALRPVGMAEFEGKIFEVKTSGDYLAQAMPVQIVKIRANEILVEPITHQ